LVARDPAVAEAIARNDRTWGERPIESIGPAGIGALTDEPLFRSIMLAGRVSHAGLERLLTRLRASLLELAAQTNASAPEDEALVAQASTLARLCFLNEYVFSHSEQEIEQLGSLRAALAEHVRDGVPVPALWLAVIGAYCSLDELDAADTLLTRSWPEPVQVLLRQQIHEPRAVRACAAEIGQLTPIDDRVSLAVQRQYEENPYPRWERFTTLQSPQPFQAYLRGLFPQRNIQIAAGERKLDYLIAGCGTGQHVAMIAQRISDVRVTAVDLSRASLGYAKHMTAGLGEIDYAQADILKLESISKRFDVIDCAGVLHHLEDWQAGWRALLSILRPRGLMQLGFYSELARRPVTEARRQIAERGFRSSTDDIRRFRRESLRPLADSPIASELAKSWDFYSVSDCRDLLFHVQEHQLNLPQIEKFLSEHKLDLLGFSLDSAVLQQYRQQFPADEGQSNISNWHVFEQQHPNTFAGMYQFWVHRQT
jgi:SAM-dependent methyltransferase